MNAQILPYGGAEILALRQNGKRPADMVLVSTVGPLRELNPVVVARPDRSYDWRFLAKLSVMVVGTMCPRALKFDHWCALNFDQGR